MGGNNENDRAASPEPIDLKMTLLRCMGTFFCFPASFTEDNNQ